MSKRKKIIKWIVGALCVGCLALGTSILVSSENNTEEIPLDIHEQRMIECLSNAYSIPQEIIYAVIEQESGFDRHPANGCGLMQIMCNPSTIPDCPYWIWDMDNVSHNLTAGCFILRYWHDYIGEEEDGWYWALNAYNGGGTEGYAGAVLHKAEKWASILGNESPINNI